MKIKLGIVGTNFISDRLYEAASSVSEVKIGAVYSRHQETGDRFAEKHGIKNVYTDYETFLESDIDAVYIASPMYAHCRQSVEAMNHGKHVLCEKTMAVNERETQEMIDCAKKNQVVLLEAMRPDFDPAYQLLGEHLPRIGVLRRVTMEYCQYSTRYDKFRAGEILNAFNPALANASIMDIGVYCVHNLVRHLGMPQEVKACSTKLHNGFEGSGIVLMQYEDLVAEAVYSKIAESVNPSVFMGEEGCVIIDSVNHPSMIEIHFRDGRVERIPYEPLENNMVYEVCEFVRLIREKEIDHRYLQYSLDTVRVVDEARRQNGIVFEADT